MLLFWSLFVFVIMKYPRLILRAPKLHNWSKRHLRAYKCTSFYHVHVPFLISEIKDPPMDSEDPRSISKVNKKSCSQPRDVAGTCLPSGSTRTALGVATVSPLRAPSALPPRTARVAMAGRRKWASTVLSAYQSNANGGTGHAGKWSHLIWPSVS